MSRAFANDNATGTELDEASRRGPDQNGVCFQGTRQILHPIRYEKDGLALDAHRGQLQSVQE
jgi:hypothetical protein